MNLTHSAKNKAAREFPSRTAIDLALSKCYCFDRQTPSSTLLLGLCRWLFFLCWLGRRLALLSWLLALLQVILLLGVLLHQLFRLLLVLLL
jgi:hypothetical protein